MKTLAFFFFAAAAALTLEAQLPPIASTQKILVDNEDVRITELNMAPGTAEPEHMHARGVTVALTAYDNQVTALPEKTVQDRTTKFGEVRWAEPSHHATKNTGKQHQRVIRVELKHEPTEAPGANPLGPLDSVIAAKETQRVLLENKYVRVVEEKTPAGVAQAKHKHRKSVLIPLVDGELEIGTFDANDAPGPVRKAQLKFANATWSGPATHTAKNIGANEGLNIRIEVK